MTNNENLEYWRKCTSCKSQIGFAVKYWVCSVSTCNRQRTGLVFCSVSCFDAHVPVMNHRDAGAIEKRSPSRAEWQKELQAAQASESEKPAPTQSVAAPSGAEVKTEILVVVSKTKDYVRAKAGLNTSDAVMAALSDKIRSLLDDAIRRAMQDERKTLLDRDIK